MSKKRQRSKELDSRIRQNRKERSVLLVEQESVQASQEEQKSKKSKKKIGRL